MRKNILLKQSPKIEFQLLDNGFQVIDEQTEQNSGFYAYNDLQAIELNKTWFPEFVKWMRVFTWIFNGVPLFDTESFKKANVIFQFGETKLGMWLTDTDMVKEAKQLKMLIDKKTTITNV